MSDVLMPYERQRDAEDIFEQRCKPTAVFSKIDIERLLIKIKNHRKTDMYT